MDDKDPKSEAEGPGSESTEEEKKEPSTVDSELGSSDSVEPKASEEEKKETSRMDGPSKVPAWVKKKQKIKLTPLENRHRERKLQEEKKQRKIERDKLNPRLPPHLSASDSDSADGQAQPAGRWLGERKKRPAPKKEGKTRQRDTTAPPTELMLNGDRRKNGSGRKSTKQVAALSHVQASCVRVVDEFRHVLVDLSVRRQLLNRILKNSIGKDNICDWASLPDDFWDICNRTNALVMKALEVKTKYQESAQRMQDYDRRTLDDVALRALLLRSVEGEGYVKISDLRSTVFQMLRNELGPDGRIVLLPDEVLPSLSEDSEPSLTSEQDSATSASEQDSSASDSEPSLTSAPATGSTGTTGTAGTAGSTGARDAGISLTPQEFIDRYLPDTTNGARIPLRQKVIDIYTRDMIAVSEAGRELTEAIDDLDELPDE